MQLFNLTDYTPLELILFSTGCFMWIIVYLIYVKNIYSIKFVEMPAIAAGSNFAWEWVWGFANHTDMGLLCQWFYQAWIIIDIYIIYGVLRYGYKQFTFSFSQKNAKAFTLASIVFFSFVYYFMVEEGWDTSIGSHSAYVCQLILSWFYAANIISAKSIKPYSILANWLRTYGTGIISVFMFIHYPNDHVLHILAVGAFVLDHVFLFHYYQRKKTESNIA